MTLTLTKDIRIAGVPHKAGEVLEVSETLATLLADCQCKPKQKKKAAKTSDPSVG